MVSTTQANEQLVAEIFLGRWEVPVEVLIDKTYSSNLWGETYLNYFGKKVLDPKYSQLSLQVRYYPWNGRVVVLLFQTSGVARLICSGTVVLGESEELEGELEARFKGNTPRFTFEESRPRPPVPVKFVLRRESVVLASA